MFLQQSMTYLLGRTCSLTQLWVMGSAWCMGVWEDKRWGDVKIGLKSDLVSWNLTVSGKKLAATLYCEAMESNNEDVNCFCSFTLVLSLFLSYELEVPAGKWGSVVLLELFVIALMTFILPFSFKCWRLASKSAWCVWQPKEEDKGKIRLCLACMRSFPTDVVTDWSLWGNFLIERITQNIFFVCLAVVFLMDCVCIWEARISLPVAPFIGDMEWSCDVLLHWCCLFVLRMSGLLKSRLLFGGNFLMRRNYLTEYFLHYSTKIALLQKLDKISEGLEVKILPFALLTVLLSAACAVLLPFCCQTNKCCTLVPRSRE